jgi:HEAT repeat protein
MTTTSSINNAFVPIYAFQAKDKPSDGKITKEWLQADYSNRVKENKKPDWIKERSLIELIGAGLGIGGFFTGIISTKNQAIKLFSAMTSLGGIAALIVGIFQGVDLRGGGSTNPETSTQNQNATDPASKKNDNALKKGLRVSEKAPPTIDEDLLKLSVDELILKLGEKKNEAIIARLVELGQPTVEPLTVALKDKDKHYTLRAGAATTLGKIKDANSVEPLIAALKDKTVSVKRSAALALGVIGDPQAIPPLIAALKLKGNQKNIGPDITTALGSIGEPAINSLIALLRDENIDVRSLAADALVKIGQPAVEPLIPLLNEDPIYVKKNAANILGEIRDPRAIAPLLAIFQNDAEIMRSTTDALVKIGQPAVDPLIALLNNDNDKLRAFAIVVLERIGQPAVESLTTASRSLDNAISEGATLALANIQAV